MGNNNGFPAFYMTFAVSKPRYTLRVDDPQKVQNGVVWQEMWLDTSIPDFCIFSNSKAVLLDWGLSFYKGSFILDGAKKHSLYATIGNITTFIGFNFEKHKFGVFGDVNLLSTGYDGRYIDAESINWAIQYNKTKITIYYDYEGIEKWATGEWKANKSITKDYVRFIGEKRNSLDINFIKVPAHSGVRLNEEVDKLAKDALLAKGHKTYNDGSVYFIGYGVQDWETIIQCINEENNQLPETIDPISFSTERIDTRTRIKVNHGNNVVVINCYNNTKSYVQGKQNSLFQKIVASAIEVLTNSQTVVETLNSYHALTLTKTEVETKFEELIPNYRHLSSKHYANLLSAVYNTMLTGYMPDYTCLVTPLFRAFEYYLHRILGDVMGLDTENDKGKNTFAYFTKNALGLYECNNAKVAVLSASQLDYLNRLYTKYNSIRHPYSHWSASDVDTAVITNIQDARQLLLDGLALIDQYYIRF